MIFLDISIEDFFKQYPVLKTMATKYSKSHKFKLSLMKPYVDKNFIGVYGELKDGCPVMVSMPQSNHADKVITEALDTLLH